MARIYLRPAEAALVLKVTRMTLHVWHKTGVLKKLTKGKRHVYYVVSADVGEQGELLNLKFVRGTNGLNQKR